MITNMSHLCIYVTNQARALDFYTSKLGFSLHTDSQIGSGQRWITLNIPGREEFEIVLMSIEPGLNFTETSAKQMRQLVEAGTFGFGVFQTEDVDASYTELKAKGVEFIKPPTQEFYAREALFRDDSGNWFSLTQRNNP